MMTNALMYILAFSTVTAFIIYKYLVYPCWISPLSKIPPAHFSCQFSSCWIVWQRYREEDVHAIYAAHKKHGPIVRLGPNELSVNCIDGGLRSVYAGNFEKAPWYQIFMNYGLLSTGLFVEQALMIWQGAQYVLHA
jgi:unspecific monooxygenase